MPSKLLLAQLIDTVNVSPLSPSSPTRTHSLRPMVLVKWPDHDPVKLYSDRGVKSPLTASTS